MGADRRLAASIQDDGGAYPTLWTGLTQLGPAYYNVGDNVQILGQRRAKWYAKIMSPLQRHETRTLESEHSAGKYECLWYYNLDEKGLRRGRRRRLLLSNHNDTVDAQYIIRNVDIRYEPGESLCEHAKGDSIGDSILRVGYRDIYSSKDTLLTE
ncbi:Hypothetical protein D9617_56g096140 [Elsinoe fawcettii]|nr:Hypothetical protein D9617_56g096140 [Elsinoe fawcettii]